MFKLFKGINLSLALRFMLIVWKDVYIKFIFFILLGFFPLFAWFSSYVASDLLFSSSLPKIWVYLDSSYPLASGEKLSWQVGQRADVFNSEFVPPKQGLADFEKKYSLSSSILSGDSPLPSTILIKPSVSAAGLDNLSEYLTQLNGVSQVRYQVDWKHSLLIGFQYLQGLCFFFSLFFLIYSVYYFCYLYKSFSDNLQLMSYWQNRWSVAKGFCFLGLQAFLFYIVFSSLVLFMVLRFLFFYLNNFFAELSFAVFRKVHELSDFNLYIVAGYIIFALFLFAFAYLCEKYKTFSLSVV